jgi:hypothetical protein
MDELHAAGEQGDTAVGVGTGSTVLQVATNGHTGLGQLTANLVVTAGEQLDFKELVAVATTDDAIAQLSFLGTGHLAVVGVRLVLLLVADEVVS